MVFRREPDVDAPRFHTQNRLPVDVEGEDFTSIPPQRDGPGPKHGPNAIPSNHRVINWHNNIPAPEGRRGHIAQPEYDFAEIAKATDTDELFRTAYDRQLTCVMKDGWWVGGRNPKAVAYIERRLTEFSYMNPNRAPFTMVLRQCAQDMVEFSNFFLYLHRDAKKSSGNPTRVGGVRVDPIAAMTPIDVSTMYPKVGDTTEIRSWHQIVSPNYNHHSQSNVGHGRTFSGPDLLNDKHSRRYTTRDIIHGYMRKRTGFIFGTPTAVPVLDDIRALRRLEEIAELIAHKHAFPLVHLKVGTESIPARILADDQSEVELVQSAYEQLPTEGALVTSERVVISAIDTNPMDLVPLLNYYHDRAVSGLGISDMDIGRGGSANRGTAVVLSRNLMDRCRDIQAILSTFFTWQLFDLLLMEGGFDLTPDNRVFLRFPEVDIERQLQIENHALQLFQGNAITEPEMRSRMGLDEIPEDQRKGLHLDLVAIPLAKAKASAQAEASAARAGNRARPENQSGKKLAKTTPQNDLSFLQIVHDGLQDYVQSRVAEQQQIASKGLLEIADQAQQGITQVLMERCDARMRAGFERYGVDSQSRTVFHLGEAMKNRFKRHCLAVPITELLGKDGEIEVLFDRLRTATDLGSYPLHISAFFSAWEGRWSRVLDNLNVVAERFGYAQAAWYDDAHDIQWLFVDHTCENCLVRGQTPLAPTQATYYGLLDRDCTAQIKVLPTTRLPKKVDLSVVGVEPNGVSCKLHLAVDGHPDALNLTGANRFLRIVLDTGEECMLPGEASGSWSADGSGRIRIPNAKSGVIELWDAGRKVSCTTFSSLKNGSVDADR